MKINKGLTTILAASTILGACSTAQRAELGKSLEYNTSAQYLSQISQNETALDAAETNREARCLSKYTGNIYNTQTEAFNAIGTCVQNERNKDKWKYLTSAVIVDGLKVYMIFDSLTGGSSKTTTPVDPTNPTTTTVGIGTNSSTVGNTIGTGNSIPLPPKPPGN